MKTTLCIASTIAALAFPAATAHAQKITLDDAEIEAAIAAGQKAKGDEQGLILRDQAAAFVAAMNKDGGGEGFSIVVYTPTTWIREQSSLAAKEYRHLTRADITAEMLEPVLRVIVHANRPTSVSAKGAATSSSVEHAVLRDIGRKSAVQPLSKIDLDEEAANAMGGKLALRGIQVTFPLDALKQLRGANDAEFFVTVVGEGKQEKDFQIKKKHFEHIP